MTKNCLITGIHGNLGQAVAKTFTDASYSVWGTARPGESTDANPQIMTGDLTRQDAVGDMMMTLKRKLDHMDVVVCTVGGFSARDIADVQIDDVQRMIELNFKRGRFPTHFFFFFMEIFHIEMESGDFVTRPCCQSQRFATNFLVLVEFS